MASATMNSETACGLLATALTERLAAEIHRRLLGEINQIVSDAAVKAARELVDQCNFRQDIAQGTWTLNVHLDGNSIDVDRIAAILSAGTMRVDR